MAKMVKYDEQVVVEQMY